MAKLHTSPKAAEEFWARAVQQWLQLLSRAIPALQLIFQESKFLTRFLHSMSLTVHHSLTLCPHQGSAASCIMQRGWVFLRLTEKSYRVWLPAIQEGTIRWTLFKCPSKWSEERIWSFWIINAWITYKEVKSWSWVVGAYIFPSSPYIFPSSPFELMVCFSNRQKDSQPSRFF